MARQRDQDREEDPLEMLEIERARLEETYEQHRRLAGYKGRGTLFWGIIGGACLAGDMMGFGGVLTAIAGYKGLGWVGNSLVARRIEEQLREVQERIVDLHEERARYEMEHPQTRRDRNLADDFSPAARAEITALRRQLREVSKRLEKMEPDPKTLPKTIGKPRFKPPGSVDGPQA